MDSSTLLRDLIVLFGTATLIAFLMRRLRQSTVIGYLLTGLVAGPWGLKLISNTATVERLAEVGVALLLFTIGLELSIGRLARLRQFVLGAASLQIGLTILLTAAALIAGGAHWRQGFFWGFLAAASSTAIVLKVLEERLELETLQGRLVLGILIFQDLCVVPMMALLPGLAAPRASQLLHLVSALGESLLILGMILLGARYLFPRLLQAIVSTHSRELFVIATVFFALGTAWGAARLGLSLALGAFLAGVVLSESEYGHQAMAAILPFRDTFSSLFFIAVGMLIDLRFVAGHALLLVEIATAIVLGKFLAGVAAVRVMGFPLRVAALTGLGVAQVGEFSFVLLREGARLGLVRSAEYQIFLAAAVITMAATPGLLAASPRLARWLGQRGERRSRLQPDEKTERLEDHVVICGFGENGRRLARLLREHALPYVIIEVNGRQVRAARAAGEPIYFGDVGNLEILRRAGVAHARAVVFAISDPLLLPRAISHARLLNPDVHIIARMKRLADARDLRMAGASEVVAEELEAWMEIAVRVMRLYGMPREALAEQLASWRGEDYDMQRILFLPGQPLRHLWHLLPEVDLELFVISPGSHLEGIEIRNLDLRARTGAAILAVVRSAEVVHNPPSDLRFRAGDQLVLIGSRQELAAAFERLNQGSHHAEPRPASAGSEPPVAR